MIHDPVPACYPGNVTYGELLLENGDKLAMRYKATNAQLCHSLPLTELGLQSNQYKSRFTF